jgi:hypothetical protein
MRTAATNEGQEIYPTCFQRVFQNSTEVLNVQDASSLLAHSPQEGVKSSILAAIAWHATSGTRVLSRTIPGPDGFVATRRGAGDPWLFQFGESPVPEPRPTADPAHLGHGHDQPVRVRGQ